MKFDLDPLRGQSVGCRSPCGERGLKLLYARAEGHEKEGRSPCGERGLKYDGRQRSRLLRVAPRAGSVG